VRLGGGSGTSFGDADDRIKTDPEIEAELKLLVEKWRASGKDRRIR
jgi:hypothetical protein